MNMNVIQQEHYEQFKALHERPEGFIMPNVWDGGSALIMMDAGFEALATSSAALATTLGRIDGRHAVSREEHLAHARLIVDVTGLPVNGDLEDGFGPEPEDVAATVKAAIAAGLAGVGIEDTTANPENPIHDFDKAVARIKAAAKVAKGRIVLTGRTDNYIQGRPDLDDTIRRLTAFAEVGADVLFAPYPSDIDAVRAIVKAVAPKPVNLLIGTMQCIVPWAELQKIGVKRLSLGSRLYARAIWSAYQAGLDLLEEGNINQAVGKTSSTSMNYGHEIIAKKIKLSTGLWGQP
jgi:2-methylisocitrate lyase-like PEP mutase family enzyme